MNDGEKQFVHLHVHTQYSLLDGATRIEKLFEECDKMNMPAVAITDHGNMYGAFKFVKQAVDYTEHKCDFADFMAKKKPFKVKPIIGCEVYCCPDRFVKKSENGKMPKFNHLVLLAKNEEGYHNLIKLVSFAFTEGLYYKPRIDKELLRKYSKGLICLSACLAGELPQALLEGDLEKADAIAKEFKALFGEDYYVEIQDHNLRAQKQILPHLVSIARANGIKLVATNDVHYMHKSDAVMQKVLQCISFRNTMTLGSDSFDEDGAVAEGGTDDDSYFPTNEFYLKSRAQMLELFPALEEALDNTLEVMNKCEPPYWFVKKPLLPSYIPEDGSTPEEFLRKLTFDGLKRKYKELTDEIVSRAEYELNVIISMGFTDYFLIVWDFINFAETHGIPVGPGRGSGVGSIVAYAIGITKLNPLKYDLIFERFLNPERVSNPDFDIDFCVDRRGEVIDYVIEKYGAENVSQIVTFGTLASKAAVKDVGRVFNQPYAEVDKIAKLIPGKMGKNHIGDLLGFGKDPSNTVSELKEFYDSDTMVKNILDMAIKIEGMPRQTGMHAAGVIICRDPIYQHVPMARSSEDIVTTEFDMIECEELGLLKMDFLGLRTLTDIKKTIDIIKLVHKDEPDFKAPDFYDMEYDDKGVFELIGEGDTHAVFQLESEGMKRFMRDLKPSSLEDIIAGISLYRPGPMDKIGVYVEGKRHPEKIHYDHPLLESILNVTYGVMVYQEQVMKVVQVLAGYSMGRADELRRMMSKKKMDKMNAERQVFLYGLENEKTHIPGAIKNGVPEDIANKIFDDMVSFASYAFNKSHAAAYAYLAYQTAYLKRYYTVEFIAAVLNNRITSIDEIRNYLSYLKERSIAVLPPDINKSYVDFTVENGAVRIGMAAIKNVGSSIISEIVKEREKGGEFTDFVQFVSRMGGVTLNKRVLESLIFAGAFDCFSRPRAQLMAVYEAVLDRTQKDREARSRGQFSFFDDEAFSSQDTFEYPDIKEYPLAEKLKYEKDVTGVYITGHPLEEYSEFLRGFKHNSSSFAEAFASENGEESFDDAPSAIADGTPVTVGGMLIEAVKRTTKTGKDLGIGKLEDLYGTVELVASPFVLGKVKNVWQKDKLITVHGKARERDGEFSIWVDSIEEWKNGEQTKDKKARKICCYISFGRSEPEIMDRLSAVLAAYPGSDKAYVKNTDDGKLYELGMSTDVDNDIMLSELYGVVGENNIKII